MNSYISVIRTKILVHGKGGVLKHVKSLVINKVELLDLWEKKMWNREKYFITNCSTSCMSVLLSATWFGISLWHYSFGSYQICYSTLSHIWTFDSPCQLRRRRKSLLDGALDFLSKIWHHITTVSFVAASIDQEAQRCRQTHLNEA